MRPHTITSEQLRALEDVFQCLIEVEENGSLRVVDGDYVSIITPAGDIAQHREAELPNEKARRSQ